MSAASNTGALFCAECGRPTAAEELARFGDLMICPACKNNYVQKLREGAAPVAAQAYAGFWIRFVGWLIDAIIVGVVGSIVQVILVGSMITIPQPGTAVDIGAMGAMMGRLGLASLVSLAIAACYEAFFVANLGATPGKLVIGVKVVRPDGSRVGLGRAFGRYFAKILSSLILLIGYIMIGFDSEKRGLHDMICDTRVIKSRT
ncbi:MAG TPA: RDD family protein [Bryobacteraceae bacterium]|nr:RDD family protein [Bryobacteraceae bacterium]